MLTVFYFLSIFLLLPTGVTASEKLIDKDISRINGLKRCFDLAGQQTGIVRHSVHYQLSLEICIYSRSPFCLQDDYDTTVRKHHMTRWHCMYCSYISFHLII